MVNYWDMADLDEPAPSKTLQQIVEETGVYPVEAFVFVQQGLGFTVKKLHGDNPDPELNRHVSGTQLCEGLRDLALSQWGLLARTVLKRWNITCTMDFGRIVFALVDNGVLRKTDEDTVEDFRNVYDFGAVFEADYRISKGSA
ncbi:MAG: hypothetical protein IT447_03525 [Phycisphaerales bacterium]|nr:hypothetical protein [Phycisphaerales bacterium]